MPGFIARLSKFAGIAICLLLVGYIGYLVLAQYRSRVALQESQLRQLAQSIESVVEADGGQAALGLLATARKREASFDLMLIDVNMPGMDGWELAAAVRADPRLDGCGIVMMPSAGRRGDAERCRELRINGYLIKPAEDLLGAFVRNLAVQCDPLAEAVAAGDTARIAIAAHTLRGSLLAIRALPATVIASALETMARHGEGGDKAALWRELNEHLRRLRAEIGSRLHAEARPGSPPAPSPTATA